MRARRVVPNLSRSPGARVRAADERWQAAWLAANDPAPATLLARAQKSLKRVHGWPAQPDDRLRAVVELAIARIHLARAVEALHDPKRRRQSWLWADVQRAEKTVEALGTRTGKGAR